MHFLKSRLGKIKISFSYFYVFYLFSAGKARLSSSGIDMSGDVTID